jgi:hypothetical protein
MYDGSQYLWLHSIEPAVFQLLWRLEIRGGVLHFWKILCTPALFKLCSRSFWELTELGRYIDLPDPPLSVVEMVGVPQCRFGRIDN